MAEKEIKVVGMHCPSCVKAVELSLTDERVTRIIDNFHIGYKGSELDMYTYIYEDLSEQDVMALSMRNSKSYIKIENQNDCEIAKPQYVGTEYWYECEYINYED